MLGRFAILGTQEELESGCSAVRLRAGYSGPEVVNNVENDRPAPKNIDEYIAGFPDDVQEILQEVRETIRKAAPHAEETIKYGIPTFTLKGNLVHFGGYKSHVGFYPTPTGIEAFKDELSIYKSSKGSVQFPLEKPIPYDLIREIVKFRVADTMGTSEAKR
jgi:uncharacterized protein YdhG (YjbR/CyaY superfamily)